MNLFEFTVLNIIFIFFPLLLYLIYAAYTDTFNKKENNLLLEFALLTSLYLTIRYGSIDNNIPILIINVPLIISYIKKRPIGIFLISIYLIYYYVHCFEYSLVVLLVEYILYLAIYIIKEKKEWTDKKFIYLFLIIKSLTFIGFLLKFYYQKFSFSILLEIIGMVFLLVVVIYIMLFLFREGEKILKLHMTMKNLEKEKQIQMSLFQITHEIKNPIAVCKGYLDMFDVTNKEHSKKYIPILKEEIDRTLILLQDFLSIQKLKIEKDILDINLLLEEIISSLEPLFKEKKIEVKSNITDDEIYINGDYNRLKQVFINLIKNSVEAMINDRKHILKIDVIEAEEDVKIEVIDNGIGIEKENLKKMKNAFFSTKQNGTGLGVYLSNEIIKAHNGKISYESNLNETVALVKIPKNLEKSSRGK